MIKRSLQITGGLLLIILGFIGWFIPIMPGTALMFSGILLITPTHGQKIINWIKEKWTKIRKTK